MARKGQRNKKRSAASKPAQNGVSTQGETSHIDVSQLKTDTADESSPVSKVSPAQPGIASLQTSDTKPLASSSSYDMAAMNGDGSSSPVKDLEQSKESLTGRSDQSNSALNHQIHSPEGCSSNESVSQSDDSQTKPYVDISSRSSSSSDAEMVSPAGSPPPSTEALPPSAGRTATPAEGGDDFSHSPRSAFDATSGSFVSAEENIGDVEITQINQSGLSDSDVEVLERTPQPSFKEQSTVFDPNCQVDESGLSRIAQGLEELSLDSSMEQAKTSSTSENVEDVTKKSETQQAESGEKLSADESQETPRASEPLEASPPAADIERSSSPTGAAEARTSDSPTISRSEESEPPAEEQSPADTQNDRAESVDEHEAAVEEPVAQAPTIQMLPETSATEARSSSPPADQESPKKLADAPAAVNSNQETPTVSNSQTEEESSAPEGTSDVQPGSSQPAQVAPQDVRLEAPAKAAEPEGEATPSALVKTEVRNEEIKEDKKVDGEKAATSDAKETRTTVVLTDSQKVKQKNGKLKLSQSGNHTIEVDGGAGCCTVL